MSARLRSHLTVRAAGIVYALILLVGVMLIISEAKGRPSYLSAVNVANILDQTSLFGIMAIFMTVVLISGHFDLSVGSVAGLAAIVTLSTVDSQGILIAVLLALGCGVAVGLLNGTVVQYVGINAFIVTLGTLTAVRGLGLVITDGRTVAPKEAGSLDALGSIGSGTIGSADVCLVFGPILLVLAVALWVRRARELPAVRAAPAGLLVAGATVVVIGFTGLIDLPLSKRVYIMLGLAGATWAVLSLTAVGRRLYAVGSNEEAAYLAGIRIAPYRVLPFVLSGAAAALAGVLFAADLRSANPTALSGAELTVIAAAILGGTSLFGGKGNVLKSIVGAVFILAIANGFNVLDLGATYQGLVQGVIIVVAAGIYTVAERREARGDRAAAKSTPDSERRPDPVAVDA